MVIALVPDNSKNWREKFTQLREELTDHLGNALVSIDHFGSTSIGGIAAKPIIDILCQARSLKEIDSVLGRLLAPRFKFLGENGVAGRRYIVINDEFGQAEAHVHFFPEGHPGYRDRILFRDYLISHRDVAKKYEGLKIDLAEKFPKDPVSYWKGKEEFVRSILQIASDDFVRIAEISSATWQDFASLMRSDDQCSQCWCLNHRQRAGCPTGIAAQEIMRDLIDGSSVSGLLGYIGDVCVGWIAVDPMCDLIGHDCYELGFENEWSIHCLFIRDGYRRRGVSGRLVEAAIHFARARGGTIMSAFPIPAENRGSFPTDEAEFSGRMSTFVKFGFQASGVATKFYQRVELQL